MIDLPLVVTAGGVATLEFQLTDKDGEALASVPNATAVCSIRRATTARNRHELPQLVATLNAGQATVTLELSADDTAALAPSIQETDSRLQTEVDCVGDVVLGGTEYYRPFRFTVRLPETYTGQIGPATGPFVSRLSVDDVSESGADVTLTIARADGSDVYLRYKAVHDADFGTPVSMAANLDAVTFALTGLDPDTTYLVRASFTEDFTSGVAAGRFATGESGPSVVYHYAGTFGGPYEQTAPDGAEILANGQVSPDGSETVFVPTQTIFYTSWIFHVSPSCRYYGISGTPSPAVFNQRSALDPDVNTIPPIVDINGVTYYAYRTRTFRDHELEYYLTLREEE